MFKYQCIFLQNFVLLFFIKPTESWHGVLSSGYIITQDLQHNTTSVLKLLEKHLIGYIQEPFVSLAITVSCELANNDDAAKLTHPQLKVRSNTLDFSLYIARKMSSIVECCQDGGPNALDFSLGLELNIPQMYYLMNNSFVDCFVRYVINCNCTFVRSTTLNKLTLDQISLDKNRGLDFNQQGGQTLSIFHSTCMSSIV